MSVEKDKFHWKAHEIGFEQKRKKISKKHDEYASLAKGHINIYCLHKWQLYWI
jgi:hypothetical protein